MVVDFVMLSPASVGTVPRPPNLYLTGLKTDWLPLVQPGISRGFNARDKIRVYNENSRANLTMQTEWLSSWGGTPRAENNYSSLSSWKSRCTHANRSPSIEFCKNWAKSQGCECQCCHGEQHTLSSPACRADKNLPLTSSSKASSTEKSTRKGN